MARDEKEVVLCIAENSNFLKDVYFIAYLCVCVYMNMFVGTLRALNPLVTDLQGKSSGLGAGNRAPFL